MEAEVCNSARNTGAMSRLTAVGKEVTFCFSAIAKSSVKALEVSDAAEQMLSWWQERGVCSSSHPRAGFLLPLLCLSI